MTRRFYQIILLLLPVYVRVYGQESSYGPGFQTIMISNPAFSGSESDGILRLSYLNFYPGNNYNLHSVFFSYDAFMPDLHGGAGLFLSDDYLGGIINKMRGGLSYAYHMQAYKNIFINAGLTASFYHWGFNNSKIILPDQIDPLNGVFFPSGEVIADHGRTVLDIGTGFLFIANKLYGGFSVNHLAKPNLSGSGSPNERLKRKLSIHIAGEVSLNKNLGLTARPVFFGELQGSHYMLGAGGVIESKYLSVNTVLLTSNAKDINIQTGFSLKKGIILVFYNYRFNIASENRLVPMSLLHQTGVAVSLKNVDKRKIVKTINFPKL
jgi:type IX secretion system PorP/SprF family membrane protein